MSFRKTEAFEYGSTARLSLVPMLSNPYPRDTRDHKIWLCGWLETDHALRFGEEKETIGEPEGELQ